MSNAAYERGTALIRRQIDAAHPAPSTAGGDASAWRAEAERQQARAVRAERDLERTRVALARSRIERDAERAECRRLVAEAHAARAAATASMRRSEGYRRAWSRLSAIMRGVLSPEAWHAARAHYRALGG